MPSKTEEYLALARRTANGLTRYWESRTAGRIFVPEKAFVEFQGVS